MTDWRAMNEPEFDSALEGCVTELPDAVADEVTPWKTATNRVLVGMALSTVTLGFLWLDYILPAVGALLSILGFRALRRENGWFMGCFVITIVRTAYYFSTLALNATMLRAEEWAARLMPVLNWASIGLVLALLFLLWRGLRAVQKKSALPPHAGGALAMMLWYAALGALALIEYKGIIVIIAMIIAYILIIRSLWKLSKELDEAGYAIKTPPVRVSDRALGLTLAGLLLAGCACGYIFGGSLPMEWRQADAAEHFNVENVKAQLAELGFPEEILNDLSAGDIAACEGAERVVVTKSSYPLKDGALTDEAIENVDISPESGEGALILTGVAVELPGGTGKWRIFHHFLWTKKPGFYGTEAVVLYPAGRRGAGWSLDGEAGGRLLYDKNGQTYAAAYHSLETKAYTYSVLGMMQRTATDAFASFSLPRRGESCRGYLAYSITQTVDAHAVESVLHYAHRQRRLQYPAVAAMEKAQTGEIGKAGAFFIIEDVFKFWPESE